MAWLGAVVASILLVLTPASAPGQNAPGSSHRSAPNPGLPSQDLEIRIPPAEWSVEPTTGLASVTFAGYGEFASGGWPSIPVRIFRVEVPAGAVPRVEIIDADFEVRTGIDLAPAPRRSKPGVGNRSANDLRPAYRKKPSAYQRKGFRPESPVEIGSVGFIRHQGYAQLRVFPVQYDPAGRRARVYSRIRVRLSLEPAEKGRRKKVREPGDRFRETYREAFREGVRWSPEDTSSLETSSALSLASGPVLSTSGTFATLSGTASSQSGPAYRLLVSSDGFIRLNHAYLSTEAADLVAVNPDPAEFKVTSQGLEIPIRVFDGTTPGQFESGDYLEFYGQKLAGDFGDPDVYEQGDFTDVNVYWLSVEPGVRQRIPGRNDGAPVSGYPEPSGYTETIHQEGSTIFLGFVPFEGAEHWYQDQIREDFGVPGESTYSIPLTGTGLGGTGRLEVKMLGQNYSGNYHRTALKVNGVQVVGPQDWDGFDFFTQTTDPGGFSGSLLTDGLNTVTVVLPMDRLDPLGDPVTREAVLLDHIDLSFVRKFEAIGEALVYQFPDSDAEFRLTGLGSSPVVYEITDSLGGLGLRSPVQVIGGTVAGDQLTFQVSQVGSPLPGEDRTFVIGSGNGFLLPEAIEKDTPSDLRSTANGADWILIGPAELLDSSPGSNLSQVLALRQSQGLRTFVADVQDVYDEYTHGIFDPQAIHDFLEFAFFNWQSPAPTYVIFLGDANYDTHNHYGAPEKRIFVPTYIREDLDSALLGYFADDISFVTVAGDDPQPDMFPGRVPAHSLQEAEGFWQKILDYESGQPPGAWRHHAVFVADEGEPQFEQVQENQIAKHFLGTPHTFERIYYQDLVDANGGLKDQGTADQAKALIQSAVDAGAVNINFVGHGGFQQWSRFPFIFHTLSNLQPDGETPNQDDIDALANGPRYPFMINTNCITGGFHIASSANIPLEFEQSYSFAEDFLITPDKGLIAALAPSHLTFSFILDLVNNTLWDTMYGPTKERNLGAIQMALRLAFESLGSLDDLRSYIFFGDPATHLLLPAPAPPTGLGAAAANVRVDLAWTASPDAAAYQIYRSETGPSGPYLPLLTMPQAGTSYTDLAVVNTRIYYYTVTSWDGGGFEGRYSNFNLECASSGPDCVRARPLNPDPPAVPTGLTAEDLGTGGRLFLTWNGNTEPDLQLYTLHFGTSSGVYDQELTLGTQQTSRILTGLTDDLTYFFSLTATNTSGQTSGFSAEAAATPKMILGISPPRAVKNLMVSTDGVDLLLTWDPVTTDINGGPTEIADYLVYANSASPNFLLEGNQLATVPDTETSYRHSGAADDGLDHYYLVAARDTDGNLSAGGSELPAGIIDLQITILAGSQLKLDWTPIARDIDGADLIISHYALYADAVPFSRSAIGPLLLVQDDILVPPVNIPLPAGNRFYSLLAVDHQGSLSPF